MAGKITDLTALASADSADLIEIVDVSTTTDSAEGSSRKITYGNLVAGLVTTSSTDVLLNKTLTLPQINDTSSDHQYVFAVNELSADRTITLPLLTSGDTFVFANFTQTLTNKTLTAPVISTISNTGTLTLPTSTDTLVGRATTDTLTNKTLTSPAMTTPSVTSGDMTLATGLNIQVNSTDPKRAFYVPASAMFPSTTGGCAAIVQVETTTNKVNIKVLDFDGGGTSKESAEFGIQSPAYWDASTVTAQFIWYASAGSGTVNWEIQGGAFSDDDALDAAYGTLQEITDTVLATGDVHITGETSAITIAGSPVAGDWINFRINRDPANDTNTSDARLMGVRIRFGRGKYDDQ